uniref:Uncharacterized protein n=1 Tax=Phlebotomus papatasi TaxID=29031 RepID=A0A1B0DQD0_PHLPP
MGEYCRACQIKTEEESQRILIFNTIKLPDIFKETTSLDIHENDGLPKVLCSICYDRLLEAYNFRKMCSAAAQHFQKILSMDVSQEKYIPHGDLSDPVMASEPYLRDIYSEKISKPSVRVVEVLVKDLLLPEKPKKSPELKKVDLECTICNLTFFRKEGLDMHMIIEHQGLNAPSKNLRDPLFVNFPPEKKYSPPDRNNSPLEGTNNPPIDQNPLASLDEDDSDDAPLISRKTKKTLKDRQKSSGIQKKKPPPKMKYWRGKPLFECCLCNSTFRQKIRVEIHMRKVHLGLKKPCECKICGLGVTRLEGLRMHMKTHENGKRFSCRKPGCNENFDTSKDLLSHMQISHNEIIWSCKLCPFNTLQLASMKRHVKIVHEKVKDFHCPYCQRAFGLEFSLKKHVMIHTGEKPFECSECDMKFNQSDKLKQHHIMKHQKFKFKDNSLAPETEKALSQ